MASATRPLPAPLLENCTICLEEQLYSQAFAILSSTLTSGASDPSSAATYLPPPQHLALAATLTVHPQFTTRTNSSDRQRAADDAAKYLRHVISRTTPASAGLRQAFRFTGPGGSSGRSERQQQRFRGVDGGSGDGITTTTAITASNSEAAAAAWPPMINSPYAGKHSLWARVDDFWGLVGWAFNCSVVHARRWPRYHVLLELLVEAVDKDLEAAEGAKGSASRPVSLSSSSSSSSRSSSPSSSPRPQRQKRSAGQPGATTMEMQTEPLLIAQLLASVSEGRNGRRRVLRAILADGSPRSLAEFGELWKGETLPPKEKAGKPLRPAKRQKLLDLEKGEYGDYFDGESDVESGKDAVASVRARSETPLSRAGTPASAWAKRVRNAQHTDTQSAVGPAEGVARASPRPMTPSDLRPSFGAPETVRLRQWLISILVRLSVVSPKAFLDTEDLFDLLTEFLRPLPLRTFEQFVLPLTPYLDSNQQASLNEMLFRPMISLSGPNASMRSITWHDLKTRYAVQAAVNASAVDNAKVSLLTESLLRALSQHDPYELEDLGSMRIAIETGIRARLAKVSHDGRKKQVTYEADDEAKLTMQCSAERMRIMLDLVESISADDKTPASD